LILRRPFAWRRAMVGAVVAVALGVATLIAALGLFVIITGMPTATHTYFGWRFARGIRAAAHAGRAPRHDPLRSRRLRPEHARPGAGGASL